MPEPVNVSQEAREAAASVCSKPDLIEAILSGAVDHASTIQAFARFEQAVRRDEAEKCLEAVRGERLADPQEGTDDDAYERALDHAEAALRARHSDKIGE